MDVTSNRQPAANASVVHVAVDLAKDVFELAFADADHRIVERKRRSRGAFARYFDNRAPLRIIMEACASSGNTRRLGRITKRGDSYLRTLLINGARSALTAARGILKQGKVLDCTQAWAIALADRIGHNKAAVALAHKTLRRLWAANHHGQAFEPNHRSGRRAH